MPLIRIYVYKGKSEEHRRAIMDGISGALTDALGISEANMIQVMTELDSSQFSRIRGASENFTLTEVTLFPGRDVEAKKRLYQAIAGNLARSPGIDGGDVVIVIRESPKDCWSVCDGLPVTETGVAFIKDRTPV
jgi:phenylpyruvate tautomerase PptA (4-oxalocrotonate tautomerase family)